MTIVNVRVDAETASFLERVARETGRTKSEVVRDALQALREHRARSASVLPSQAMADLIGAWDSGGLQLSERTGERFAEILKETEQARGTRRRRSAGRANRSL